MDGFFGVLQFGYVGEGGDNAEDGSVGTELRDGVPENPQNFRRTWAAPSHGFVPHRARAVQDAGNGESGERSFHSALIDSGEPQIGDLTAQDLRRLQAKHSERGLIGEFDFAHRVMQNNPNVEVADQGTETLFAFPKSVVSIALLSDVGKGN